MIARALLFIAAWLAGALLVIIAFVFFNRAFREWCGLRGKTRREVREAMG
jgi:hypothetical protein